MKLKLMGIAFAILALCFVAIWWLAGLAEAVRDVVLGFAASLAGTILAIAFLERYLENLLHRSSYRQTMGAAAAFWDVPRPQKKWTFLFKGTPAIERDPQLRLSLPTLRAFLKIGEVVKGLHGDVPVELRNADEVEDWPALMVENVVVLGGYAKFPGLPALHGLLDLPLSQKRSPVGPVVEVRADDGAVQELATQISGAAVTRDYAIVVRLVDPTAEASLLMFSGGEGVGTACAVAAMAVAKHVDGLDFASQASHAVVTADGLIRGEFNAKSSSLAVSNIGGRTLTEKELTEVRVFLQKGGLIGAVGGA
jgi:hypothetical protein